LTWYFSPSVNAIPTYWSSLVPPLTNLTWCSRIFAAGGGSGLEVRERVFMSTVSGCRGLRREQYSISTLILSVGSHGPREQVDVGVSRKRRTIVEKVVLVRAGKHRDREPICLGQDDAATHTKPQVSPDTQEPAFSSFGKWRIFQWRQHAEHRKMCSRRGNAWSKYRGGPITSAATRLSRGTRWAPSARSAPGPAASASLIRGGRGGQFLVSAS
jgi:hypothetical protein